MTALDQARAERDRADANFKRAEIEHGKTMTALDQARAERDRADANFKLARDAINHAVDQIVEHPLLREADFFALRKELLSQAIPFFEALSGQRPDATSLEADIAHARARLGFVYHEIGDFHNSLREHMRSAADFERLGARPPNVPGYRFQQARSLCSAAIDLTELSRFPEAEAALQSARKILDDLVRMEPESPHYRYQLASCHSMLSNLMWERYGTQADALAELNVAIAIRTQIVADVPGDPSYRLALANDHGNRAMLHHDSDKAKAETDYRKSLAILNGLVKEYAAVSRYRVQLSWTHDNLGTLLLDLGMIEEALPSAQSAVALRGQLAREFPGLSSYRDLHAWSLMHLAWIQDRRGNGAEAEKEFRTALDLWGDLVRDYPKHPGYRYGLAYGTTSLGDHLRRAGRRAEAAAAYQDAMAVWERLTADYPDAQKYSYEAWRCSAALGAIALEEGQLETALRRFSATIRILESLSNRNPERQNVRLSLRDNLTKRARTLEQLGRGAEASDDHDRARELGGLRQEPRVEARAVAVNSPLERPVRSADDYARLVEAHPEEHWNCVFAAFAQLQEGRMDRYRGLSRAMLQRFESSPIWQVAERTGKLCLTVPDRPEFTRRAADLAERGLRLQPDNAWMLHCAALADYRAGRFESALARARRGRDAIKTTPFGDRPGLPALSFAVEAMAQARLDHTSEAQEALKQAKGIFTTELAKVRGTQEYQGYWQDWVHCQFLVREAQAVVADLGFPDDPFAR
jgi:tetratricopeptide (TPR) repeat protein